MRRLLVAIALLFTACGGDDEVLPPDAAAPADAPEPADAMDGVDADNTDAGPQPDAISCVLHGGQVRENVPGDPFPTLPPLADVLVTALVDGAQVAQTASAADGTWSVCVPPDTSVALAFEKAGFNNQIFLRVTNPAGLYLDVRLFSVADLQPFWDSVGATYPSTTDGFVTVIAFDSPALTTSLDGVSASVSPASGTGPFYFDDTFAYNPALTETSTLGLVVFANVQPGLVNVTLDHATRTCTEAANGFASPMPNALRVPVRAGVETSINVKCE